MKNEFNMLRNDAGNSEQKGMEEYYTHLDQVFSAASKNYDEKILSNFVNVNIRNMEMKILFRYSRPFQNILEIGCGTGEESKRFILNTGKSLQCIDIAAGMVAFSEEKMRKAGIESKFKAMRLGAGNLKAMGEKFELIYSFNGAFNTEPDTHSLVESLMSSTEEGSMIIFSVRNKKCLGESIFYGLTGRISELKVRRSNIVEVEVAGEKIRSRYYSKKEVMELFSKWFRLKSVRGLGITMPPYMAERIQNEFLRSFVAKLDRLLSGIPFFRTMGDETAYIMERK